MSMADPAAPSAHVLVVDDDQRLRGLLDRFLTSHGYLVTAAADADDADTKLRALAFDIIVLDVMMPGEDGVSFARRLRQTSAVPILMLTARGEAEARITGLEAGADDYLQKPFEPRELLLRIGSILRRAGPRVGADPLVEIGRWRYDPRRAVLVDGDETVGLSAAENGLLRLLVEAPGEIISREDLALRSEPSVAERTVDVQVTRLRRKIEADPKSPQHLQTVRGEGYVLWLD